MAVRRRTHVASEACQRAAWYLVPRVRRQCSAYDSRPPARRAQQRRRVSFKALSQRFHSTQVAMRKRTLLEGTRRERQTLALRRGNVVSGMRHQPPPSYDSAGVIML